ncbi:LysR family transcriptional regulator [Nonomuraea sp. NPDC046570]|uniref:LysR family transcriptional regulator n=1 Tax=Nonomuraea sp. NPDC046570 TaxID=3155255 RepID=UPI0033E2EB41
MDLEARHLRYIDAIAAAGSITQAAVVLGMSQPSLTAQVRRIERTVGGRLFDRGRHGVRLTPLGEVLALHAREVLDALDDLRSAVRRFHDGTRLRVGVMPTVLAAELCDVVAVAVPERPVDLTVVESRAVAVDALAGGELDLVLHVDFPGRECVVPAGVRMTPVGVEPVFVAVPAGHPAASRAEVSLTDLAGATWLVAAHGDDEFDRHLAEQCAGAGLGPITVRVVDPLVMAQMIRRGDGVAVPVQALDGGTVIPGVVVALRDSPLRVRHLLLWTGNLDEAKVDAVRAGLVSAYLGLAANAYRLPDWRARHRGWLGSPA